MCCGVAGMATAAGCQLVASCDIAIVSDVSKFATPGLVSRLAHVKVFEFCTARLQPFKVIITWGVYLAYSRFSELGRSMDAYHSTCLSWSVNHAIV